MFFCLLGKQELSFRGHDESERESRVFQGTSAPIQNYIVNLLHRKSYVKSNWNRNVHCQFVSILLDETTDISRQSQLSVVFRYVVNGNIIERFYEFADISENRPAAAISSYVIDLITKLKIKSKFIGQGYDGAAVMSGQLGAGFKH